MKKLKNKGITLVALVITIVVLLILVGVSIAKITGDNGIISRAQKAKEEHKQATAKEKIELMLTDYIEEKVLNGRDLLEFLKEKKHTGELEEITDNEDETITVKLDGYEIIINENNFNDLKINLGHNIKGEDFNRSASPGKIEVVFIDKENKIIDKPLEPILVGNMKPIKLNSDGTNFEKTTVEDWGYNYVAGTGTQTNTNSIWANAQTKDGSMFVWIPRYAYKITYYDTDGKTILGYSNAKGIVDAKGNIVYENGEGIETVGEYIVHPAFTDSIENGGWTEDLKGIWIGKFEVTGNETTVTVKPGEYKYDDRIDKMFTALKNAKFGESVTINSHMIKNSEWGAVTYLTHSQYGTNRAKLDCPSGNTYTGNTSTISDIYTKNIKQSSTQNAYGVYGLSGGIRERVASYVNNTGQLAGEMAGTTKEEISTSTEYKTVYKGTGVAEEDYKMISTLRGDAIFETTNASSGKTAWFEQLSVFPIKREPLFIRGGDSSNRGMFGFDSFTVNTTSTYSSTRACLAITLE